MLKPSYTGARRRALPALLRGLCLAAAGMASAAHAQLASPLATPPTNAVTPGEVVFADLVTTDVDRAARFYTAVFGWAVRESVDPGPCPLTAQRQQQEPVAGDLRRAQCRLFAS